MPDNYILTAIVLGALVSWLPRVLPFILVKMRGLPDVVLRFLTYLPLTIIFALTLSSLVSGRIGQLPSLKWQESLAALPTIWVALRYKNLLWTVLVGVFAMAILRNLVG